MTSGRPPQPVPYDALHPDDKSDRHTRLLHAAASLAAADLSRRNASADSNNDAASLPQVAAREDDHHSPGPPPTPPFPASQVHFQSLTTAPSPPLSESSPGVATTPPKPTEPPCSAAQQSRYQPSPLGSGASALRIQTDIYPSTPVRSHTLSADRPTLQHKTSASSLKPVSRTPSLKTGSLAAALGTASGTSSTVPSPIITAMGDVTPLPSPLLSSDSPGPWKMLGRPPSREAAGTPTPVASDGVLVSSTGETIAAALAYQNKRKAYGVMDSPAGAGGAQAVRPEENGQGAQPHARNRSISEYIPDPVLIPKRMSTVSGANPRANASSGSTTFGAHLRREPHLSESRGLTPAQKPPTPPPSESSVSVNDSSPLNETTSARKPRVEYFEARGRHDRKRRRWRAIKVIGQGTFSRVMLATSQVSSSASDDEDGSGSGGMLTPDPQSQYDRRTLVAVKVCEHGPMGGASEERIEMSLKRELEIMQSIHHPSLVHLKSWNIEPTRAILVLSYCAGGDLFDVASTHRELLTPNLMQRIFAELVGATSYLHERRIVHRDIKLENVLVNLPASELASTTTDWTTYPYPVVTLTDLGLSRRIADDERLETRCGSDDYAAPEVIMGQPYDGRATDAWSLGVLLYALLESRLPFDPPPGAGDQAAQVRMRSRTSHRIARVEWRWVEYGAEGEGEGDHDADVARFGARGLGGAMEVVEGLLKRARSRWSLGKVAAAEWVARGVCVEGGIRFREEEEGEEVL